MGQERKDDSMSVKLNYKSKMDSILASVNSKLFSDCPPSLFKDQTADSVKTT